MKKTFTFLMALLLASIVFAQSPEKMSYQAVIRYSNLELVTNAAIGMQISILQGSESGTPSYVETQNPTTNANGLASIEIGDGTVVSGNFLAIDWTNGPYFIKTETDPSGGTSYSITGNSQLLSVPFALHAKAAERVEVNVSAIGDTLYIGSEQWIIVPGISEANSHSGTTVTDVDGNVYSTVTIGTQEWLVGNLKTTKYSDGTSIPLVTNDGAWNALLTPGYCWYNNDEATYKDPYGALYNWHTINSGDLCPIGWHVPTHSEWIELTDYLGGLAEAGGKLKEAGTEHWNSPNAGATNESGFTALPGGYRFDNGAFDFINIFGYWWSASEANNPFNSWYRELSYYGSNVYELFCVKKSGFSVRCLKD